MTIDKSWTGGQLPTPQQMKAVAERRITQLSQLGDDLLQQLDGLDAETVQTLKNEATRLFWRCHEITEALARGDIEGAYRISSGGADQGGDVLGVAV